MGLNLKVMERIKFYGNRMPFDGRLRQIIESTEGDRYFTNINDVMEVANCIRVIKSGRREYD